MKFSVVIPVYNGADTLEGAMRSVLCQSEGDLELIVVNDGSTDGTKAIADRFAAEDGRVKVVTQQNAYLGAARNRGLDEAKGEYVFFLDADDLMEEGLLKDACEKFGADVIATNRFHVYDERTKRDSVRLGAFHEGMELSLLNTRLAAFSPYVAQSLYRREFLAESGVRFSEIRMNAEDRDFTVRLLYRSRETAVLERAAYRYTAHREGSLMNRMTARYIGDSLKVLEALYDEVDGFGYADDSLKRKIANEYLCFASCAALIRDKELSDRTMGLVVERMDILGGKYCSASKFLWLRPFVGLKRLLRLCNAVFLHYTTDQ